MSQCDKHGGGRDAAIVVFAMLSVCCIQCLYKSLKPCRVVVLAHSFFAIACPCATH